MRLKVAELEKEKTALLKSDAQKMAVLDGVTSNVFFINKDMEIVWANNMAANSVNKEPEEMVGHKCYGIFGDQMNPCENCPVVKAFKTAKGETSTISTPDGRIWDAWCKPILDPNGNVTGVIEIAHNITMLKQAQESLAQSEWQYRRLVEISPNTVLVQKEGRIQYINPAGVKLFGASSPQELIGRPYIEFVHPDDRNGSKDRIHRILSEDDWSAPLREHRLITLDGQVIDVESTGTTFSHGNRVLILTICRDITQRKRAEKTLRMSEGQYRTLMELMPDAVVVFADEQIAFANPAASKMLGADNPKELIGRSYWKVVHPDYHKIGMERIQQIQKGDKIPSKEFKFIRVDGETVKNCEATGEAITFQGRPALLAVWRDISERKRTEEEKVRLASKLRQAQKMESIGTLAGGIAHDFNNLLMGIQGNASLILLGLDVGHPYYEKLKSIEEYVKSGADLTRQLLGFARGGKYEVKSTNLNNLIMNHNRMFGRTKKEVTIHGKYEKDLWTVDVDQGQIEQVLMNLYVNAWQAMPRGGDIHVQTENIILDENLFKTSKLTPGKYAKITVTDTGEGMDKDTQEKIFDPFFTTKEMARGTGLGLASVYGIIMNHGGLIDVYSEKGEGSTFNIYLPASEKTVKGEKKPSQELLKGKETVLLVDDEDMIIDVGGQFLESMGYKVLTGTGGKEAVEIYKEKSDEIDLVIVDMVMPDMGGGETYDIIKKINPNVKVLLSSGYSINGHATEILERGCNGFIQKPFNMKQLSQKIKEVLDTK